MNIFLFVAGGKKISRSKTQVSVLLIKPAVDFKAYSLWGTTTDLSF